jgi:protein-tyrosine phosphatase
MIDIHSHILAGVDDGASSVSESEEMLSQAGKAGIKTIIATPHYREELFAGSDVESRFADLKDKAEISGITLLKGYEIKIQDFQAQMPADFTGLTLNGTRYVLLELPFEKVPKYTLNYIYELQLKKYIPVLAHPERCKKLVKDSDLFLELIGSGCLLQVDAASIIGVNGKSAKRFAKNIIKKGYASYVASDAHNPKGYSYWYVKAYGKVQRWIGKEKARVLFSNALY